MILRDPVHGLVAFEAEQYRLIPELWKPRKFNACVEFGSWVWRRSRTPARITRASHAIGAAHVMTRFVTRLRNIHETLPFLAATNDRTRADAVAAALLHDVGHGPFSHLFEEALPSGPKHEVWTRRILLDPESDVNRVLTRADPGMPLRVAKLVGGEHDLVYLAHTVSGMFDVDRCDYLLRDALFTGVNYGHYDLDWLLRSLCLINLHARVSPRPGRRWRQGHPSHRVLRLGSVVHVSAGVFFTRRAGRVNGSWRAF